MWRRRGLAAGCLVTWLLATQIVLAVPSAEVNLCKCDRVRTLGLRSPPLQGPDVLELQERLARWVLLWLQRRCVWIRFGPSSKKNARGTGITPNRKRG